MYPVAFPETPTRSIVGRGNHYRRGPGMTLLERFRRPDRMPAVVSAIGEVVAGLGSLTAAVDLASQRSPLEQNALGALARIELELKSLRTRVDEMELTRAKWEANTEASLIRALEDHKAARRSEERERAQRGKKKRDDDEEGTLGALVSEETGSVSEAPRLSPVPTTLAHRNRSRGEAARAAKWGG